MSLGGYPMGAQYDPRAPWNEREPTMVKCEACDGNGKHWHAYDIKGEVETCEVCNGDGEVEYEEDYEPDYED